MSGRFYNYSDNFFYLMEDGFTAEEAKNMAEFVQIPDLINIFPKKDQKHVAALIQDKALLARMESGVITAQDYTDKLQTFLNVVQDYLNPKDSENSVYSNAALHLINYHAYEGGRQRYPNAEDLYKLRDDLALIAQKDKRENKAEMSDGLIAISDRAAKIRLQIEKKKEKAAQLSDVMREAAKEPHIILYSDDKNGTLVVPLTMAASQYWGSNTKWCTAAAAEEDNKFHEYNASAPLIRIVAKPTREERTANPQYTSFKFGLHEGNIVDENDIPIDDIEDHPYLARVLDAAEAGLDPGQWDYIERFLYEGSQISNDFVLEAHETYHRAANDLKEYQPFLIANAKANPFALGYITDMQTRADIMPAVIDHIKNKPMIQKHIYRILHLMPNFANGPLTTDMNIIRERLGIEKPDTPGAEGPKFNAN
jgi:hypothetical protein